MSETPVSAGGPPTVGRLPVARLRQEESSLEVETSAGGPFGTPVQSPREPHRHDYHEICWTRVGWGVHLIDGRPFPVVPGTLTLIRRGQIHVFERGNCVAGAVVRFGDELLADRSVTRALPRWLLDPHGHVTVHVPPAHVPHLEGIHEALAAETSRPLDSRSIDVQRYLIATLLLWVDRWYEDASTEQRCMADADAQLYARFLSLLDQDFASHHDTRHYAAVLAAPPVRLSRVLVRISGRTSKELITDRVMVEAARLLRFTDLAVGEVAVSVGFDDRFYFSRAFKRRYGESPLAYRARLRGLPHRSAPAAGDPGAA